MKKTLIFLLLLAMVQAKAQTYPITSITISLPANPDANTANWGSGTSLFTITANAKAANGRVDGHVAESKILVTIKKGGAKVCGSFTANSAPASNFNTLTKVWSGSNAVSLLGQGCALPPGEYELTVQFFGAGAAGLAPLSEERIKPFSIRAKEQLSYQPPQAIAPANGTVLSEIDIKKPITFRWTPVVPRPQEPVTYRLKVWQLMQGQNGAQAMATNQPIITKDVDNLTQTMITNLISGPCLAPYLCDFIWNVQALNREGKPLGGNNGMSEALKFNGQPVSDAPSKIALVFPANGSIISAKDKPKFTWTFKGLENNYSSGSNQLYKIKIVEIKGNEMPEEALRGNKPFFEKDSLKPISFQYPLSAPSFIAGKKYGWNVSIFDRWGKLQPSAASMFFASSCDVYLALTLKSIECLPATFGNNNYKICLSATYNSSSGNLTYANAGSGFNAYNSAYSLFYGISNITPALQVQNNFFTSTVDYCFDVIVPPSQTTIKIGLQGDDKDPGPIVCRPGAELDVQLPVCDVGCKCGKWNPLVVQTATGIKRYDCGSEIEGRCNQPFNFSSAYQCNPNNKDCQAKVKWTITKDGNPYSSGTGTTGAFTPTANGTYTITLESDCNGVKCPPCVYKIIVKDCVIIGDKCECGSWNPLAVQNAAGTKRYDCGSKILWSCKTPFQFTSSYQCSPNDKTCEAKTTWEVRKGDVIIKSGTGTNNISDGFNLLANGIYTLTLNAECNGKKCPPCIYTIVVEDCTNTTCDCGKWNPLTVQNAAGTKRYDCGSKILWSCKTPFQFTSSYQCSPNDKTCEAKTTWEVRKGDVIIKSGTGTNNISDGFSLLANGIYTLTLNAECNGKKCPPCIYTIVVEDCKVAVHEDDSCKNNLIRNGGFDQANVSGTMPSPGSVQYWVRGYGSPIVDNNPANGFIEKGYIELAGNINSGQAVAQTLDPNNKIIAGKKYKLSVAVRFSRAQNTLDYVKIRAIAYNGNIFSATGNHPPPSSDVAIIGRGSKIRDCNDWSVIEFPVWIANKDFSNIAINAFTNDGSNAKVWIDNITICESAQEGCDELQLASNGNPIIPAGYGAISPGFNCQPEAEEDDYYNGSLQDLYPGYNGTTDLYSQNTNLCTSIGGTLPPEVNNYNCDESLRAEGIDMTCEELQNMLNQEFTPTEIKKSYLAPIPTIGNNNCDRPRPKNMENMPFQGRDIIYIHGLQLSHIIDRANGNQGAVGKWPNNQSEYYSGYYKNAAVNNMLPHIDHFLKSRGNINRYIIVSYDCSENAEVAIHAVLSQIREAMENGTGVVSDPSDPRKTSCFGRDYVMISHSTGALVADVVLSIANKTKTDLNLKTQYGDIGLISDRCKGRVSIQGAYSGSNLAKIAVVGAQDYPVLFSAALTALAFAPISNQTISAILANTDIIPNSILVDLVPSIARSRWGAYINDISVPVFTLAGGHPSAILGPLKYSILKGFDDGVLPMDGANGNNNPLSLGPSSFNANPIKVFDMGIPLIRGVNYYLDQRISQGVFAAASTAYLSPTGMVVPVSSINVDPQNHFSNHYSFIQSAKEHWFNTTELGSGNIPCDYSKTLFGGSTNNEEELVVTNASLFTLGLINPSIISQMGETLKDKHIDYPWLKLVYRHGIPRPTVYWKKFYIWKRTYHKLIDNCMYDVDYAYKYLFNQ